MTKTTLRETPNGVSAPADTTPEGFLTTIRGNQQFRNTIEELAESRTNLTNMNKLIRSQLTVNPYTRIAEVCGRVVGPFVPNTIKKYLPTVFIPFVSEEVDVLELIEKLQRENITNVQESLNQLAATACEKRRELDSLATDLNTARRENWDARRLQNYIASKAGIKVYDNVAKLLDGEFRILSQEERERRKEDILERLQSNIAIGQSLMETLVNVCLSGTEIFHHAIGQYYDYVNTFRPVRVIREAAKTLTETNETMYAAGDVIVMTFTESVNAIELAMEAARMTQEYAVASQRTQDALEKGREQLEQRILALRNARHAHAPRLDAPSREEQVLFDGATGSGATETM